MKAILLKKTKKIGLDVIHLSSLLPSTTAGYVITKQIIRSSTSIGANYRAACRAKSRNDFIYKLKIVEEETDETIYWLEIMEESGMIEPKMILKLKSEVIEILSILVTSLKTLRT